MTPASPDPKVLDALGEFFAAGLCELPEGPPIARYSRAYRRWFENCQLPDYDGGRLCPCGHKYPGESMVLSPDYSFTRSWNEAAFVERTARATPAQQETLRRLRDLINTEEEALKRIGSPHTIGGAGYTHAIVNYDRVLAEGLDSCLHRLKGRLDDNVVESQHDLCYALVDLIEGIQVWHRRLITSVERNENQDGNSRKLVHALRQVPFRPARDLYEAVVAYNVIYYIDGCDNPGRIDQVLKPYYENDDTEGRDEALALMRAFFDNVCANGGWSAAIGGSHADGNPAYNELTEICIEASHHRYRPSLELRVREDMPDKLWELSMDALATGCGQPAFYSESGYLNALRAADLGISEKDLVKWNGGGCTETMLHGCSNVGSLDAGFNLPLILEETLKRTLTRGDVTFEEIVEAYKEDLKAAIGEVVSQLNTYFEARGKHLPQPIRTLLVDDCIDRGIEFNGGGARYNWSVVNVAGLANVADSLEAIRDIVFNRGQLSPVKLLGVLERNFDGMEPLRQRLLRCPKFGNDISSVDCLATEIGEFVYREILSHKCSRGGKFLPSHIMFETFADAGRQVGATPDGRPAGEPLADSAGPVQGRDTKGPTAMLRSVARLPQHLVAGTPILNMRFSKAMFEKPDSRRHLRALIETYFKMGGLQLQISVLDREELLDALEHPDKHENLIVRIGGYSTYFNRLSDELKREVIKRTEYVL